LGIARIFHKCHPTFFFISSPFFKSKPGFQPDLLVLVKAYSGKALYLTKLKKGKVRKKEDYMKVERIDHIHIFVSDLKQAAERFSEVLGSTKWVGPIDLGTTRTAFDNLGFELVEVSPSSNSLINRFVPPKGEGFWSIGLRVPNLEDAIADLEAKGVRCIEFQPGVKIIGGSGDFASLRAAMTEPDDMYGVMFELVKYDERTPTSLANLNRLADIPSPI